MPAADINQPARSLTIDQAYARAYAQLRQLYVVRNDVGADEAVRASGLHALEAVAKILERELTDLFYDRFIAEKLARPE